MTATFLRRPNGSCGWKVPSSATVPLDWRETLSSHSHEEGAQALCSVGLDSLAQEPDVDPVRLVGRDDSHLLAAHAGQVGRLRNREMNLIGGVESRGRALIPESLRRCVRGGRVYSVAATLYYLLTGTTPHELPPNKDPHAVLLERDAVPIAERRPGLPEGLGELIHQALARRTSKRF